MKKKLFSQSMFIAIVLLVAGLTGCKGSSVVSDSPASSASPAAATTSAPPASNPAASPNAAVASQPTPSPTLHPIMKQAQAQPGVPVAVPESMRRPLNAEEMQKALQAMPPEVRARIQGMQAAPQGAKPQPTPKQ